jgi:hypothetical protein
MLLLGLNRTAQPNYELRISGAGTPRLVVVIEARPNLYSILLAFCPAAFVLMPAVLAWATVAEPPTHWAAYPGILALAAFLVWLGIAHLAMNFLQGFWGTTRLEFAGDHLSQRITWRGRVLMGRSFRIGPAASARGDAPAWFGVLVRGLAAEQSRSWWKRLLLAPNHAISFGACLSPEDARVVTDQIRQHLQAAFPLACLTSGR